MEGFLQVLRIPSALEIDQLEDLWVRIVRKRRPATPRLHRSYLVVAHAARQMERVRGSRIIQSFLR